MTNDELFDASGSLTAAKRICRSMMADWDGVVGPFRWLRPSRERWELEATVVVEQEVYVDAAAVSPPGVVRD